MSRSFQRNTLGFLVAASFALTSCGPHGSRIEKLTAVDVTGTWESNKGGRITFTEGGAVSFSSITQDPYCVPENLRAAVPRTSGDGKWKFETIPDELPGVRIEFNTGLNKPTYCTLNAMWVGKRPFAEMYLRQDDGMGEVYRRDSAANQ